MHSLLIIIVFLSGFSFGVKYDEYGMFIYEEDYCKYNCKDFVHTVCLLNPCEINLNCIYRNPKMFPLNEVDIKEVLKWHNYYRRLVSAGNSSGALHGITASNMHILNYDRALAFVAQCWANYCSHRHDMCRTTKHFNTYVGQNIGMMVDVKNIRHKRHLARIVRKWGADRLISSLDIVRNYSGNDDVNHLGFTQLIWAETTRVGCGRLLIYTGVVLVCNYGIGGNIAGQPIFKIGPPCSKCAKCSSDGLLCISNEVYKVEESEILRIGNRGFAFSSFFVLSFILCIFT